MSRPRLQFGLRWLIVAVALAALNMVAILDSLKHYPRRPIIPMIVEWGGGARYITKADGSQYVDWPSNPGRPPRMLHGPRPTLPRVWAPVIASGTASLVVLFALARFHRPKS